MARPAQMTAEWARLGAMARLGQIANERAAILKAYPALRRGLPAGVPGIRPKRRFSAEARKRMSEGMRKYWAKRKAVGK